MISTVRVQEKGQVTIPRDIRRKLKLKKGDLVTFVSTDQGVVIKPLDQAANDLLEALGKTLRARGVQLDRVMEYSRHSSRNRLANEFGLTDDEVKMLYQAMQLEAQAAVEAIRASAEETGLSELTDEDIEAEIQQARGDSRDADRP